MTDLTVREFAASRGVSRQAVHRWLQNTPGLRPRIAGGMYLLSPEDQQRILDRPRMRRGWPAGKKRGPRK